jgi:gp16 family phage-associated protein
MEVELEPHRAAGLSNLRSEMERQGVSVKALSEQSGVSRPMLHAILKGERQGRAGTDAKVAEALGIDPGLVFPRTQVELDRAEAALMGPCS